MTKARETQVRVLQRKMLRNIVGTSRAGDETYADWMVRATAEAETIRLENGIPDWVEEIHRRKFSWAGHIARCQDGRWTHEVLLWAAKGKRSRGRPKTRWADSLNKFFRQIHGEDLEVQEGNEFWVTLANDRQSWRALEEDFLRFVK